jgi:cytochrome P450
VERALRDAESFSRGANPLSQFVGRSWVDEVEHARVRKLSGHAFRPKVLERWRTEFIGPLAGRLVDGFVSDGRADLSHQFAMELPIQVISRILGLPVEDYPAFRKASFDIMGLAVDPDRAFAAMRSVRERVDVVVDQRREAPGDDLISDLVTVELDGERMSNEEVFDAVLLLIVAGNETTASGVGTIMSALLTHPDELALLVQDRSLIPQAVEEGLRWDPPAHTAAPRVALHATELGGHRLEEGDMVLPCLASANRDERYYDDGERFWVNRPKPHPHLTFAAGPHFCLGHHLARMELEMSVSVLLDRLANIRIVEAEPTLRTQSRDMRLTKSLPVLFDSAAPIF